jgi:hypothetical protein
MVISVPPGLPADQPHQPPDAGHRIPRGEILLGPPKSRAGRRVLGIPQAIIPLLREHLTIYVKDEPGALAFPEPRAARCGEATSTRCPPGPTPSGRSGADGMHFHDLRHAGNTFSAASGAGLRGIMARMGHDSERAAMIYQHDARGADQAITGAIDQHVQAEHQPAKARTTTARRARSLPWANGPLMARKINNRLAEGPGGTAQTGADLQERSWSG